MKASQSPTMVDVAAQAGVALKTVSRYVNGETNIDPALAERIRLAIETLGYRRNLQAASIRPGRRSRVVGLIISDLANPYYSVLTKAVEALLWSQGYLLTTVSSEEDGARHDRAIERLMEQRVDALLVVPPRVPGRPWSEVRRPIPPVVFLDRPAEYDEADTVLADNTGGARDATTALVRVGSRRIAFVGDSLSIYTMAQRFDGYQSGLAQSSLLFSESLLSAEAHSSEQACAEVERLVLSCGADAIFAANNRAAIGALSAFSAGVPRVPMIAFDDFEAAPLVTPAISVVSQDVVAMGRVAAELALERISGTRITPRRVVLATQLILRGSERQYPQP